MKVIDRKIRAERTRAKKLQEKPPTAAIFAKRMGIDPSLFSRWRTDDSIGVSRETLTSMQIGFSDDPLEQAELLAAVLSDRKHGPAADLVEVRVLNSGGKSSGSNRAEDPYSKLVEAARATKLDERMTSAITHIVRSVAKNRAWRQLVLQLAKSMA